MNNIIHYHEYLKGEGVNDRSYTRDYPVPDTAIIPQPGDKIIAYMKSQFDDQVPYYSVGIKSVNHELHKK